MTRRYIVLVERQVDTDVGDVAFVLLDFYDASRASIAKKRAQREHGLGGNETMIVVPATHWRTSYDFIAQPAMVMPA